MKEIAYFLGGEFSEFWIYRDILYSRDIREKAKEQFAIRDMEDNPGKVFKNIDEKHG